MEHTHTVQSINATTGEVLNDPQLDSVSHCMMTLVMVQRAAAALRAAAIVQSDAQMQQAILPLLHYCHTEYPRMETDLAALAKMLGVHLAVGSATPERMDS